MCVLDIRPLLGHVMSCFSIRSKPSELTRAAWTLMLGCGLDIAIRRGNKYINDFAKVIFSRELH
jgi:hypothetical protein